MKLLLVVILIAGAQSAPRPQFTEVGHLGHFEIVGAGRSINLPDGCTFISSTQNREGDIIKGEYSYEDPVGSKITVSYQLNTDGSNYLEKRTITKGYKTEGNPTEQALVTQGHKHQIVKVGHTIRLTPFVLHSVEEHSQVVQQDQSALLAQQKACANQVVQSVKTDLEPIIIRIVGQTVRNSNADLNQYDNLVGVIISQLRPVILNEVNSALSGSTRCANLNAEDLTDRIVVEITPFVKRALEEQIRELEAAQAALLAQQKAEQAARLAQQQREEAERLAKQEACANKLEQVVQSVKTDLEPIIIQVIRQTVRSSNADVTQYDNLVVTIIGQLRPVILNEVRSALIGATGCDNLNADDLTNRIVVEITPFVKRALEEQIREFEAAQAALLAQQQREEAERLAALLAQQKAEEAALLAQQQREEAERQAALLAQKQREEAERQAALLAQQQREEAERLAALLAKQKAEQAALLAQKQQEQEQLNIVQSIINQLDPFIKTTINDALGSQTTTTPKPQLSSSQSKTITSRILSQLRYDVESATNQYLEGSASSVSNNVVAENVIAQFQPQIISAIEGDATIQQTFSSGSFVGSDAFSDLFGQIIIALRGIIFRQITAWRASQVVVQPVPVAPVAPAGGNAITSIFGTGGANSVQVETPNYNYEYNHARSLESRSLD